MKIRDERLIQINQKINLESDLVLYPEACKFVERLIEENVMTLGDFQIRGLYNMTLGLPFKEGMLKFLHNQQQQAMASKNIAKRDIATYYNELEKYLINLKKRINNDLNFNASEDEMEDIHNKLVREFVQHLIAANGEKALELALDRQKR